MRATAMAQRPRKMVAQGTFVPAPTGGWDAVSPLPNMPPDRAVQLDNFIPRPGWIEVRRGWSLHATVGTDADPVETLMSYNGFGAANKQFAVAGGSIYDTTATGGGVITTVTGLANSRMQWCMFSNASGTQYIFACNGADTPKIYDGSSWGDASISGSGITPANFINVNAHKGRLWFIEKNSTDAVYMAVGAIAGSGTVFPLGSFMTRGGFLQAIGTWTIDTRQTVDEYIAFVTSRGQVIVYQGTDPATADTWVLVGIYDIGAPIGYRCFLRIGGDLIIISIDGLMPMSEMLSTDRGAANRVSISSNIMNAMAKAARVGKDFFGWQFIEYAKSTLAVLNVPVVENETQQQFVMNTLTGAWCRFTGMNANCWTVDANDNIYFGSNDGFVGQWDVGASDYLDPIMAVVQGSYQAYGNPGIQKRWTMLQPLIFSDGTVEPSIGINVDFRDDATLSTPSIFAPTTSLWDEVDWDGFDWATSDVQSQPWTSVTGIGHYASISMQVVTGTETEAFGIWGSSRWGIGEWATLSTQDVTLQINGWNIVYEPGTYV